MDRSEADIRSMESVADKAVKEGLIQIVTIDDLTRQHEDHRRQLYTIPLDHSVDVTEQVWSTLEHIEAVEQIDQVHLLNWMFGTICY